MIQSTQRTLFLLAGLISLALGILGIFLPLLPTTPFVLLAAFCFSKSSKRLHHWLLHQPQLGPLIVDWEENGAIRTKVKVLATLTMLAVISYPIFFMNFSHLLKVLVLLCILGVLLFIWSRPSRPRAKAPIASRDSGATP